MLLSQYINHLKAIQYQYGDQEFCVAERHELSFHPPRPPIAHGLIDAHPAPWGWVPLTNVHRYTEEGAAAFRATPAVKILCLSL